MPDIIPETSVVRIRNMDPLRPFIDDYGSQRYTIPAFDPANPDASTIIAPYFAMVYWCGDPRAIDIGDRNTRPELQHRTIEVDRLSTKYGVYGDAWYPRDYEANETTINSYVTDDFGNDIRDNTTLRHKNLPRLEVFTLDNVRLYTVLDDPEGTHMNPPTQQAADTAWLQTAVAQLQQQLAQVTNELARQNPEAAAALTPISPLPAPGEDLAPLAPTLENRDPEVDPDDPDSRASVDLPPNARAALARKRAPAKAGK